MAVDAGGDDAGAVTGLGAIGLGATDPRPSSIPSPPPSRPAHRIRKSYRKHAKLLTNQRTKQAAKDFASYRVSGDAGNVVPVASGRLLGVDRWAGVPKLFGMPNGHCPGTIALVLLGGNVVRHSQTPGDRF